MNIHYTNFDLQIEYAPDEIPQTYMAQVLDSPAGQAQAYFDTPLDSHDQERFTESMFDESPNAGDHKAALAQAFGAQLFDVVFVDDVRSALHSSLALAFRDKTRLRIRLRLVNVPELAHLPWEYLYDAGRSEFFALSVSSPIVRYIDLMHQIRPMQVDPPLRILVVIATPDGFPELDVEREWDTLFDTLEPLISAGEVLIEKLDRPTLFGLQRRLRQKDYHILHFIGHGTFDATADSSAGDGILLFENDNGGVSTVNGQHLGTLLRDHYPLRLVVLNACQGAQGSVQNPYAGVAQSLVRRGVPAVVAMQYPITDTGAVAFARSFYAAIVDRYPIDASVSEARKSLLTAGLDTSANTAEWGTPVLFMRAADGHLFESTQRSPKSYVETTQSAKPTKTDTPRKKQHTGVSINIGTGRDSIRNSDGLPISIGDVSSASIIKSRQVNDS